MIKAAAHRVIMQETQKTAQHVLCPDPASLLQSEANVCIGIKDHQNRETLLDVETPSRPMAVALLFDSIPFNADTQFKKR